MAIYSPVYHQELQWLITASIIQDKVWSPAIPVYTGIQG